VEELRPAGLPCPPQSPQPLRPPPNRAPHPPLLTHLLLSKLPLCSSRHRLLLLRDLVCSVRWLRLLRKSTPWILLESFKMDLHVTPRPCLPSNSYFDMAWDDGQSLTSSQRCSSRILHRPRSRRLVRWRQLRARRSLSHRNHRVLRTAPAYRQRHLADAEHGRMRERRQPVPQVHG
jgi:hypothetical protein